MASGYDESAQLFHMVNGTDIHDELKIFTELKPVRLPFQDDLYASLQESYDDYQVQNYGNVGSYNNELQDTSEWAKDDSNSKAQEFMAENIDPVVQNLFDSQPICNQGYFSKLDDALLNLPRELNIERLIEQANNCEETISMYRNILVNRARQSEKCPNGPLYTRRTTKLEISAKRYANDCYALQLFIDNDDPRVLTETIIKRRTTIKSEPIDPNTPNTGYENRNRRPEITSTRA